MKSIKFGDKHLTLQEWNRFNKIQKDSKGNFVPPGNDYNFNSYTNLEERHNLLKGISIFCTNDKCSTTDTIHGIDFCDNCKKYDEVNLKYPDRVESLTTITTQEILLTKYDIILDGFETKWPRKYHKITKVINMKNFDKGMKTFDKSMQSFSKGMGETNKISKQNKKNLEIINGKSTTKAIGDIIWGITKNTAAQFTEDQTKKKKKRKKAPNQCTCKSDNSVPIYSRKQPKFF